MADRPEFTSPTLHHLATERTNENLSGAKLTQQRRLFGREYDFYDDGSVLVVDPMNAQYHFLTQKGRERGKTLRNAAKELINFPTKLGDLNLLGEGKGGFSKVYDLPTENGSVAVKATDGAMFFFKEMMGEATSKATGKDPMDIIQGRRPSRKIVQKMSLQDTMKLFKRLDTAGVKRPEFYGFSVKRNAETEELQELQFMEKINKPTFESLMEAAADAEIVSGGVLTQENFRYAGMIQDLADKYFNGDQLALMKDIVPAFSEFVRNVKQEVWDIGDVVMDNIFFAGYDEGTKQPDFMLIDPIEEHVYLAPLQYDDRSNTNLINKKI